VSPPTAPRSETLVVMEVTGSVSFLCYLNPTMRHRAPKKRRQGRGIR